MFNDITSLEALYGYIDYRCFYVINTSTDALISATTYIDSQVIGGSSILLGFNVVNDVQTVIVTTATSTPTFTDASNMILQKSDYGPPFTISANLNPSIMASNFQTQIRLISHLGNVTVVASGTWPVVTFTVTFQGESGSRLQPLLVLAANNIGIGS